MEKQKLVTVMVSETTRLSLNLMKYKLKLKSVGDVIDLLINSSEVVKNG